MFLFTNSAFAEKIRLNFDGDFPTYLYTDTIRFTNERAGTFTGKTNIVEAVLDRLIYDSSSDKNTVYMKETILVDLEKKLIKIVTIDVSDFEKYRSSSLYMQSTAWQQNDMNYSAIKKYVDEHWQSVYDRSSNTVHSDIIAPYIKPENKIIIDLDKQVQNEKDKPRAAPPLPWNGKWSTSRGEMLLKQVDNRVEGTLNGKKFSGIITENKLTGTWSNMKFFSSFEPKGEFEFSLFDNDTHIKIKWKDQFVNWVTDYPAKKLP